MTGSGANTFPPLHAPDLLRRAGLRPRKSLGQNFLIEENALQRVAEAARLEPSDTVLEIGPGLGSLTRHLAVRAKCIVAVEIDRGLASILRQVVQPYPNVVILEGDILSVDLSAILGDLASGAYKVAANIPYYITSAVIRRLLDSPPRPSRIVLTVQQEVADRICAQPGAMSLLSLSVQYYGDPVVSGRIPAASFYPAPKVDSAIIAVEVNPERAAHSTETAWLFRTAKAGFSQKRKMLRNTISAGMHVSVGAAEGVLRTAGIDPQRRAETLDVLEWIALSKAVQQELAGIEGEGEQGNRES